MAEDPNKILKETVETVAALNDAFNSLGAMIKSQLTANIIGADDYTKKYVQSLKSDAAGALKELGKSSERILFNQYQINKGQLTSKDISKQILDVELRSQKAQIALQLAAGENKRYKNQALKLTKQIQEAELETIEALKAQAKEAEKVDIALAATEKRMKNASKLASEISKIPILGSIIDTGEMSAAMKKAAEENRSIFAAGFKEVGKNITSALTSGVSIIKFFLDAAFKANKQSVELGKSLGYGAANSDRVRENFVRMEHSSDNINVNTANLAEASNQLTESTGYTAEFSQDQLETQIMLTKQLKLSSEEASGIYQFSVLQGKSANSTYQSMVRGYVATRNSLRTSVPFKAAIAEAAKISGQLASNLGNNPEKIIKAVVATRALGTSLEQAKSQGESLLDFQTSIENELKAELITGEQLNLERARAAALMGDQVTVANELAAQGMTSQKFSTMNVLAQKAYAEALGTTSDELANQLKKREIAISQGKSLAQVTAEEADAAAKRQDIQEKFNVAMDKIKSVIGNLLAGPLSQFLESLSQGLVYINEMVNKFGKVASTIKGMLGPDGFKLLGSVAGAATVGALILAVGKSLMKGTRLNPVVVTVAGGGGIGINNDGGGSGVDLDGDGKSNKPNKPQSIGQRLKNIGKNLTKKGGIKRGLKGLFKGAGGLAKGLGKRLLGGNAIGALAMGGLEAYNNAGTGMGGGESIGRALLSGGGSLLGGALGSLAGPLGTFGGGVAGGMAGDALGDYFYGAKPETQSVEDGVAKSGGPFQIRNKYGQTAITAAGDKLAVSPNINNNSPMDLSPMIAAINQVTAAVADLKNKSWDVHLDSKSVGTGLIQKSYRSA
jgi:hypothetical protein